MREDLFAEKAILYRSYLTENVMPFWLKNSLDQEVGGYFTCLDREGNVYDTDKFVWLQCREVWMFAMLYNQLEQKKEWLDAAILGAEFLIRNGRDPSGRWYFSLDRSGRPLVQAYNIFSDCFATMAFAQLAKATNKQEYADIAVDTFYSILRNKHNPKGSYNKAYPGTRDLKGFSLPMILCNLVLEIDFLLEPELVEDTLRRGVSEVMEVFYREELGLILEHVDQKGNFNNSFEGRLVNPGHGLESMWFVMDIADRWEDEALKQKCVDISLSIIQYGWDEQYGGIFYFKDVKGYPLQQLEWDQKLWWVHVEAMITMLKGYQHTKNKQSLFWYEKLHEYVWKNFVDANYPEMYGYLNRQGEPLLTLKGGKWKGCFHVPRAMYQLYKTAGALSKDNIQIAK